ncbi:apoptotic chromatin condensation inducer in the nucleus [Thalassophryne amazonica]|uniref:apoptotic chromatin condensation inducer in the nucleus n=1 Tax=Thalassophryne amazonica TaxID=390379 RepID=UPI001470E245|nr:apoptotic chromatin condensation inducer in the nucleus [Thalassophryne amazonica]
MSDLDDVTLDGRPLQSLRVADLKVALKERGLSKSGKKKKLIKRLKGALMENLQRTSTHHTGRQPNSQFGEEMSHNSIIKQYLAKQQELLRQCLEREAREAYETNEQDDHTETNNSTSCPQTQDVTPMLLDQHKPPCLSGGEGLSVKVNQMEDNRNNPTDMSSAPASAPPVSASGSETISIVGGERQSVRGHTSRRVPADSDEEDGDDDWVSSTRRRSRRQPARARVTRERSGASRHLQQQHIPSVLSPQLRQPTPPPSPPPELSFPLPDTPKQSPPSPGVQPARQLSSSTSSSGSSSSSSRSSSPEPQRSGQSERKPGPLTLLARKMESEGAFCSAGWHSSDRQDGSSPSTTEFSGTDPQEGTAYAIAETLKTTGHVPFPIIPSTTQVVNETHSPYIALHVHELNAITTGDDRKHDSLKKSLQQEREERQWAMELERNKPLEWEQTTREEDSEQNRLIMLRSLETERLEKERLERENSLAYERLESNKVHVQKREYRQNLERERVLQQEQMEREKALERQGMAREKALEQKRLERERIEREKALEQERLEREKIEREKALEQERLERERIEREKALEQERLERERIEREKALEQERLERERIEREKALEQERLERERALEQERLEGERVEREKTLEQERLERERVEREKALEQERLERERALEQERLERERVEREKALEQERLERERVEREKALEQERLERERVEREKALEQERLERERLEREKALEQERLERERLEREKALEQERLERERIEREKALEQERLERERIEREKALEQELLERERIEREKALEQERLERERIEREKALEQERLERERALEQKRLAREQVSEQQRVLEKEWLAKENKFGHESTERVRKENERIESQKSFEIVRIVEEKALEQEREEKENIDKEKTLEQESIKVSVDKERKEKFIELQRLEKQKEGKHESAKVERHRDLERECGNTLECEEMEITTNETDNERVSAVKQVEKRVTVVKPTRESTLPPSKQRSEICLIPLPTPPPLSTGADKKSTEAGQQEGCDVRDPVAWRGPRDAKSCASVSPTSQGTPLLPQTSLRKPRFVRDLKIHHIASPTSTFLKRPRTFSDSPNPHVSPVMSSASIGVREEETHQPSAQNANSQIQTSVELVGGPSVSAGIDSEGKTAVIPTLPGSPRDQRTNNLISEDKGQADFVEGEQHFIMECTKKLKELNEDKSLSSPIEPVVKRGRASSSSSSDESSSSDSDSGSSSSTSSGSSSSSPERTTEGKREGKGERDPSPQPTVPVESRGDVLKERQKAPVHKPEVSAVECKTPADGTTTHSKQFFEAQTREEQKRKRAVDSGGEEEKRDKKRQVKMNAVAEQEKLSEPGDETPKAFLTRKISLSSSKVSSGSANVETEQTSSVSASRKRRWGSSTAVTARKPSISITTDSLKSLIPDIGPSVGQETVVDLNTDEFVLSGGDDDMSTHPPQALQIQRTVTQEVPVEIQENGEEEAVSSGPADVAMVHEEEPLVEASLPKVMETKSPPDIHNVEMGPVIPSDLLIRRSISQEMLGVSITIDDPVRRAWHPSPPHGNVSSIVHICNLVRPFTLGQLKELLGRTGTMVEEGFWIDKIKSHCYVTYSSPEEAAATQAALHGVKWPQSNPKLLTVEFCQQDELDFHKALGTADKPGTEEQGPSFGRSRASGLPSLLPEREPWTEREREMGRRERARLEREWGRNKVREFGKPGEGRDGGLRKSPSKDARRRDREKTTEEPPAKLLDDLFLKTKATPCIYWLPNTEEQIVQRELDRAERRKLREQRLKELEEEKQEEERKERMKAAVGPTGGRDESEKDKDRARDRERNKERVRERDRERETDKRKESYRREGGRGAGGSGSRRSHSRSNPRERRR